MKILFWNTHGNKDLDYVISNIVWENQIDIIALAEYPCDSQHLIDCLSANDVYMQQYLTIGCEKIILLGNVSDVQPGIQDKRFSIQIIQEEYILCAMHLPSQISSDHWKRRAIVIRSIVEAVERHEKELGSKKSILVGDINEDPYEDGCLCADNFHGLPCKVDAERESRIVEGKTFHMFYNPMWNFFGDFTSPPGTYYYSGRTVKNSFWHIFDQVLIRPCLKDDFVEENLQIVTKSGIDSLLDAKGHPDTKFSDHLPIIFEISGGK